MLYSCSWFMYIPIFLFHGHYLGFYMLNIFRYALVTIISWLNYKSLSGLLDHHPQYYDYLFALFVPLQIMFLNSKWHYDKSDTDLVYLFLFGLYLVTTITFASRSIDFKSMSEEQLNMIAFPYSWLVIVISIRTAYKTLGAADWD
jgi:hypothetical protein